jgi:hypothetical protein
LPILSWTVWSRAVRNTLWAALMAFLHWGA